MPNAPGLKRLVDYLQIVPSISGTIGSGFSDDGRWWVKFAIDIKHPLAWNVVQEFAHVLNYLSIEERLPAVFMPVSPPPYLNGGPEQFLSWVIESKTNEFPPDVCVEWLEGRLPRPVNDLTKWKLEDQGQIRGDFLGGARRMILRSFSGADQNIRCQASRYFSALAPIPRPCGWSRISRLLQAMLAGMMYQVFSGIR
jgi:hypothetical protein